MKERNSFALYVREFLHSKGDEISKNNGELRQVNHFKYLGNVLTRYDYYLRFQEKNSNLD